jgi:acetyl esterase/lipase
MRNSKPFSLSGRINYRIRNIAALTCASIKIPVRRLFRGPQVPGWSLKVEMTNYFLRSQSLYSFNMPNIKASREYQDALVFYSPALASVETENVAGQVTGTWFSSGSPADKKIILYFRGGAYVYFAKTHNGFIANITRAAKLRIFAPDYPLIPENPYPAQLYYALKSYQWLLEQGNSPENIIFMGDSAGGNLSLTLPLKLRASGIPLPSSVVALCPWTDVGNSGASMSKNEPFDWVEKRMPETWSKWFLSGRDYHDPLISPIYADLRNLPPIYIQAGGKEILFDMIKAFYDRGVAQGVNIKMDIWESMNHDFQAYGETVRESSEALQKIAEFVRGNK